jgi:N-acetylglucosamine-6-phosphate deacetylase
MTVALTNGRVFDGETIRDGLAVVIEGERIAAVVPAGDLPSGHPTHDLRGALLAPGFIDSQVNGGAGALFNAAPTVETVRTIGRAHRAFGTTGFLPTLLSDRLDVIERGIAAVDEAIAQGVPGVLGIHIEGPFLCTARKGIHDPSVFLDLTAEHIPLLTSLRRGRTLITLAPERADPSLITALVEAGAVVAIGHSDATYAQTRTAIEHGASGFTHLFNAMSPLTSREPGVVGAALEDSETWCPLIVDGAHAAPATMRIAARIKPADKLMLVTDAMPTVGDAAKRFELYGREITVRDGVCKSADGTLAGSDLDMAQAVRNTVAMLQLPPERALAMASAHPAAFLRLGEDYGRIAPGFVASLVALDQQFNVVGSWINGQQ